MHVGTRFTSASTRHRLLGRVETVKVSGVFAVQASTGLELEVTKPDPVNRDVNALFTFGQGLIRRECSSLKQEKGIRTQVDAS